MKKPSWTLERMEKLTLLLTLLFVAGTITWFLLPQGKNLAPVTVTAAHSLRKTETTQQPDAPGLLEDEIMDINTVSEDDLTRLPGIGQTRAEAIVAWREANGGFTAPEDILKVRGIGEKTYERIAPYITVGGAEEGEHDGADTGG